MTGQAKSMILPCPRNWDKVAKKNEDDQKVVQDVDCFPQTGTKFVSVGVQDPGASVCI